jgi:hypothetical protein
MRETKDSKAGIANIALLRVLWCGTLARIGMATDPQTKTNLLFKTKTRHCHIVPHCHVVWKVANQHRPTKHTTYFSPTNNKRESLLL